MTDSGFHANLHQRVAIPACLQKAILCLFASCFHSSPASDGPNFRVLLYWMSNARHFGATYPASARYGQSGCHVLQELFGDEALRADGEIAPGLQRCVGGAFGGGWLDAERLDGGTDEAGWREV